MNIQELPDGKITFRISLDLADCLVAVQNHLLSLVFGLFTFAKHVFRYFSSGSSPLHLAGSNGFFDDGRNKIGILVLRRNQVLTCQTATDIHVEIVQQLKYLIRHHKAETVLAEMQGGSVQLPEVFERMPQLFPAQSAFCTNVFHFIPIRIIGIGGLYFS